MKLAFVALGDPRSPRIWSGTPHHALREMTNRFPDLHIVDTPGLDNVVLKLNKLTSRLGVDLGREPAVTRRYAAQVEAILEQVRPDAILSVGASNKIAHLRGAWPIVHVSDALFGTITNYYKKYRRYWPRSRRLGDDVQQRLIDRASAIVLTSHWAKESAEEIYDVPPGLIKVAPLGANLDWTPDAAIAATPKDRLRLLFIGIDWIRKGGPPLLAAFEHVRTGVPDAELHIVGCEPPEARDREGVFVHGYLRKADPVQRKKLEQLFSEAAFFVMLSEEEAFGLVYCEAAAYGLPSIALRTGGVPSIVVDGSSGKLFEKGSPPQQIAEGIVSLWRRPDEYQIMRRAARREYETRLNWTAWGDTIEYELRRAAKAPPR